MHISTLFVPSILFEFRGGGNRENLAPLMHLKSVRHKTIYNQYLVHLIAVFHSSFSSFCSPSEEHFLGLLTSGKNEFLLIVTCDRCCILLIFTFFFFFNLGQRMESPGSRLIIKGKSLLNVQNTCLKAS